MWPHEEHTMYLIHWERGHVWVLYESNTGGSSWDQVADSGAFKEDEGSDAFEWAKELIYRAKGNHRFTLNGPNNQILNNYTEID